ncbi:MAG: alpha/beta fold hydrolase, partial [Pelovirga sp.]
DNYKPTPWSSSVWNLPMRLFGHTNSCQIVPALLTLILLSGCDMDEKFIFFPTAEVVTTPQSVGLGYEDIYFTSADGAGLHGWLVPGEAQAPMVLFFHGNAGNISHRVHNLRLLHQHLGVSVFIIDYRGYGNSTGRPSEAATYADARGALTWLIENGWRNDQIIYFGRSLGAAVATQLTLEAQPAGLVLESPFTSIAAMGRRHNPILYTLFGWLLHSSYDTMARIDQINTPLLLLHGTQDRIVPPAMVQQLFARAEEPKTLHLIEGAGHNDTLSHHQHDYWLTWRTFIESVVATDKQSPLRPQSEAL